MKMENKVLSEKVDRKTFVLFMCIAGFVGGLLVSSITASKLISFDFLGLAVAIPVGTSLFAITFVSTDVISEVWGRSYASLLVLIGFIARIVTVAFLYYAVTIPGAEEIWNNQEAYESVLRGSGRILLAGIFTYPISQFTDIYVFHYFKKKHEGKNLLWLRNTGSTLISQFVDSTSFILMAFYGLIPNNVIVTMILGQVIIKWVISLLDTPIVYIIRNVALGNKLFDFRG